MVIIGTDLSSTVSLLGFTVQVCCVIIIVKRKNLVSTLWSNVQKTHWVASVMCCFFVAVFCSVCKNKCVAWETSWPIIFSREKSVFHASTFIIYHCNMNFTFSINSIWKLNIHIFLWVVIYNYSYIQYLYCIYTFFLLVFFSMWS